MKGHRRKRRPACKASRRIHEEAECKMKASCLAKSMTSYLSWLSLCWQYHTTITVPIWADSASRANGMGLSRLPLKGHFCSVYSHSVFIYAFFLYRLL